MNVNPTIIFANFETAINNSVTTVWPCLEVQVCDCFALQFLSNLPKEKRVEQSCEYMLENCIDADSAFSMPIWCECTASSLRTIKACELFHAHFNALLYIVHHNIFVLVSALQKIQNETYIKMRSVTTQRLKNQLHSKKRT